MAGTGRPRRAPLFQMPLVLVGHRAEELEQGKIVVEEAQGEDATATAMDAMHPVQGAELRVVPASSSVPTGAWSKRQRSHRLSRWLGAQDRQNAAQARSATLAPWERRREIAWADVARHARCRRAVGRSFSPPNIPVCEINDLQR